MIIDESEWSAVMQIAERAEGLLSRRGNLSGSTRSLSDRLFAAGIDNIAALDGLIYSESRAAREKLGLRTLHDVERILTALGRARKEIR